MSPLEPRSQPRPGPDPGTVPPTPTPAPESESEAPDDASLAATLEEFLGLAKSGRRPPRESQPDRERL